jgi:hypothetical protein
MNDRGMNTSPNTNQTYDTGTRKSRAKAIGFLRRSMAGVLLAAEITTAPVGLRRSTRTDVDARAHLD